MHTHTPNTIGTIALLAFGALGACSGGNDNAGPPPAWILAEAPAQAESVADAKANAAEGGAIVVRGIIGGQRDVLGAASPVFRIVDASVHNECLSEDDHCPTPWDYCCVPREQLTAASATVQVVDAAGTPVQESLVSAGLSPLDEVVVVGTVGQRPSPEVLTIQATGIHIVRR
jgi:hypothetical protein